jgi:hypothetical protein
VAVAIVVSANGVHTAVTYCVPVVGFVHGVHVTDPIVLALPCVNDERYVPKLHSAVDITVFVVDVHTANTYSFVPGVGLEHD